MEPLLVDRRHKDVLRVQGLPREKLERYAFDRRTGLYNINAFPDVVKEQRSEFFPYTLLAMDIVGLKHANSTPYGTLAGDYLIRSLGRAIRESIRDDDLAGHLREGDEMGILTTPELVEPMMNRVKSNVDSLNEYDIGRKYPGLKLEVRFGAATIYTSEFLDQAVDAALRVAYSLTPSSRQLP